MSRIVSVSNSDDTEYICDLCGDSDDYLGIIEEVIKEAGIDIYLC